MKDRYTLEREQRRMGMEDPVELAKYEALGFLLGDMDSPVESITEPPTTDDEINKLIEGVKAEYEGVPEFSMFGDPNWRVRDATIEILEWARG
ncbi:hypothetical protein LCGC14_0384860 [marine sediment metagenome]|uniref:Uncharacterized protein n=1 Tax=marine sediment metagenome TaxID=412755 RepID=A0A0F9T707_9ZZZZ